MNKIFLLIGLFTSILVNAQVANDECATATPLTVYSTCTSASGTLANATTSTITTSTCGGKNDVFYKFVAPSSSATITVTPSSLTSTLDLSVGLFNACGTTNLVCRDATSSGSPEKITSTTLVAGTTYYVKVSSYNASPTDPIFTICVVSAAATTTPPANDECTSAAVLTPSATCTSTSGTLLNATTSTVTTSCGGYYDVFYKFVATATSASVIVTPSSALDPKVSVFSTCGGTSIACKDDGATGDAETAALTSLVIGTTYYAKVSSFSSSQASDPTFTICVVNAAVGPPPPANDECTSAAALTPAATCTTTSGSLLNATTSSSTTSCGGYYDVFYKFVATATSASVTVTPLSTLDPKVSIFSTCGSTYIACMDDNASGDAETAVLNSLSIGTTYYVKVSSFSSSLLANSAFTICVVNGITIPPPANDECISAETLIPAGTCTSTSGTLLNATTSTLTTSCGGYNDVFYKFVATSTSASVTVKPTSTLDSRIGVFTSCGSTNITCVDNSGGSADETASLTSLIIGSTYYIKVSSVVSSLPATPTFTICVVNTGVPPVNDECAAATAITPSTVCNATSGTLANATTSTITTSCGGFNDVFYKFVATAAATSIIVTPSGTLDPKVSIFNACGATNIACIDGGAAGDVETVSLGSLNIGSTYYIKVSSFSSSIAIPTFTICVVNIPSTAVNDECASAATLTPSATCVTTTGTLANATTTTLPTPCGGYNDVFYKFVAASTLTSVVVTPSSNLDVKFSVFSTCGTTTSITCVDGSSIAGGTESVLLNSLTVGTTYYIKVASLLPAPTTSTFTICLTNVMPAQNDECANAIAIVPTQTSSPVAGNMLNAGISPNAACTGKEDVFYKFVAVTEEVTVNAVPTSPSMDVVLGIYSSCTATTAIVCVDSQTDVAAMETANLTGLTIGETYFIRIQNYLSQPIATSTFTVDVINVNKAPANDECASAVTLPATATCIKTTGTLANATSTTVTPSCNGYNDVFYKFVAGSSMASVTVTPLSTLNPIVSVFTACGSIAFTCMNASDAGEPEIATLTALTVGNTYYIKVSSATSTLPSNPLFTICVMNVTPIQNDECANATTIIPTLTYSPTSGTLLNSSVSATGSCVGNNDVFYKFVALSEKATVEAAPTSSSMNVVLGIYSSCTATTAIICKNDPATAVATETAELTGLTVGETYFIRIQNALPYSALVTPPTFTVDVVYTPAPPVATGTQSSNYLNAISIFPNPVQHVLNITSIKATTTIELVDLTGRSFFTKNIDSDSNVDMSDYAAGVYILKLTVDNVTENRRVVLSK